MKTELPISRNVPPSEFWCGNRPYAVLCRTCGKWKKTSESGPPGSPTGMSSGPPKRHHQFLSP
jgi:hypothetical protein